MKALTITTTISITDRSDEALCAYLNDVSKTKVLPVEEERELVIKAKAGNKRAFNKLIESNLRIVISVAKKYQGKGLSLSDIIEEGNTGLIEAFDNYDINGGTRFATYATWYVRRNIIAAINNYATNIHVPGNVGSLAAKVRDLSTKFVQLNERQPTVDELAEQLNERPVKIAEAMEAITQQASLDEPFKSDDNEGGVLGDTIFDRGQTSTDSQLAKSDLSDNLDRILFQVLSERDAYILKSLFGIGGFPKTTAELHEETGLTTVRINQIKNDAIKKLKAFAGIDELLSYLAD